MVSGPPSPSKCFAFDSLKIENYVRRNIKRINRKKKKRKSFEEGGCYYKNIRAYRPLASTSPPSSTGMSLFPPAPLAVDPYWTVAPGNLFSTDESTPDSTADEKRKLADLSARDTEDCAVQENGDNEI